MPRILREVGVEELRELPTSPGRFCHHFLDVPGVDHELSSAKRCSCEAWGRPARSSRPRRARLRIRPDVLSLSFIGDVSLACSADDHLGAPSIVLKRCDDHPIYCGSAITGRGLSDGDAPWLPAVAPAGADRSGQGPAITPPAPSQCRPTRRQHGRRPGCQQAVGGRLANRSGLPLRAQGALRGAGSAAFPAERLGKREVAQSRRNGHESFCMLLDSVCCGVLWS